jgi:hypothetical protein
VLPLGIGGGSHVRVGADPLVGPESVGYRLTHLGRVFGGDTLTATDIAVAGGRAEVGDARRVADVDPGLVRRALASIEDRIGEAVDRMKTASDAIPVVVVGGGSILLGDSLPGAGRLVRPAHHSVANAIGAAIAQVGGEVDQMFSVGPQLSRDAALEQARELAAERAVAAGAVPDSVRIVDQEELALAYVPGNAIRIKVKAVRRSPARKEDRCDSLTSGSSPTSPSGPASSAPAAGTPTSGCCWPARRSASTGRWRSWTSTRFRTTPS